MTVVLKVEVRFWGCCWDGQRVFMHSKVKIKTKADWMKLPKFLENGWLSPFDVCLQWNGAQHPSPGVATQESTIPMAVVTFLYTLFRRLTLVFLLLLFFYSSSTLLLLIRSGVGNRFVVGRIVVRWCFPRVFSFPPWRTSQTHSPGVQCFRDEPRPLAIGSFGVEWLGVVGWVILIKLPMSSSQALRDLRQFKTRPKEI